MINLKSYFLFLAITLLIAILIGQVLLIHGFNDELNNQVFKDNGIKEEIQQNCHYQSKTPNEKILRLLESNPTFGTELYSQKSFLHPSEITSVAFSPNSTILASSSINGSVKFWDVTTGEIINTLKFAEVVSLSYSIDGTELAIYGSNRVWIWDMIRGRSKFNITTGVAFIEAISYSHDSNLLVTGGAYLKLWNITDYNVFARLVTTGIEREDALSVSFSPDGKYLVSGHDPPAIQEEDFPYLLKVWNVTDGKPLRNLGLHNAAVMSVDFSADGKLLASGSVNGSIKLWNVSDWSLQQNIMTHENSSVHSVAFSPKGKILASGGSDSEITLWNVTSGERITSLEGHTSSIESISFSPSGTLLASGSRDNSVKFWSLGKGVQVQSLSTAADDISSVSFSGDGKRFAAEGPNDTIKIWNVSDNYELTVEIESSAEIKSIAFSPDGLKLVSGDITNNVSLWDTNETKQILNFTGHQNSVNSVSFSPNGEVVASGSIDTTIKLWNVSNGQLIHDLTGHTRSVFPVTFSTDGKVLASGSLDDSIKLWNVTSGMELPTGLEGLARVNSLDFSPNNLFLVSGDADGKLTLWNFVNGFSISLNQTLSGHTGSILSVDFSSDGRLIASGSSDNTIRLWNASSGELIQTFFEESTVLTLAFSPNSKELVSGTEEGSLKIWTIDPLPVDIDGDLILDSWEREHGLNQSNYWDIFDDPDEDGLINCLEFDLGSDPFNPDCDSDSLPDGWEYLMGLDLFNNDTNKDKDGDNIPNFYEYLHGLNSRRKDGNKDQDGDGMSNYWEFMHRFSASDPNDAGGDPDGDWVVNLEEFRGGSDPHNFWSVPTISLSVIHIALSFVLFLLLTLLGILSIFLRRKSIINRLNAPDYGTVLKIKSAGYLNYAEYLQAESDAKKLMKSAYKSFFQGEISKSIQQYQQALSAFELLQNSKFQAEITFRIGRILKDMGELEPNSDILQRFPKSKKMSIKSIQYMINALVDESKKDWISAEHEWKLALNYENLDNDSIMICRGALVEIEIRQWMNNPVGAIPNKLIVNLDNWQRECKDKNNIEGLCSLLLLRARMSLASFLFNEVTKWLDECQETAEDNQFQLFINIIRDERKRFSQYKKRISSLLEAEKILSPADRVQEVQEYLKEAFFIVKKAEKNDSSD
jgi:WD40 repeat protein/tetratricopeptide (TPR) repeat protein